MVDVGENKFEVKMSYRPGGESNNPVSDLLAGSRLRVDLQQPAQPGSCHPSPSFKQKLPAEIGVASPPKLLTLFTLLTLLTMITLLLLLPLPILLRLLNSLLSLLTPFSLHTLFSKQ